MNRSTPSTRKHILAEELVRSYNYVRRFVGVRLDDDDGAWLLSRPDFAGERLNALARALLAPTLDRHAVAAAAGARELLHLTPGNLGKAWFHLGKLERRDEVQALIDEGLRPLRSFRGRDLGALLDACRDALQVAQRPARPWSNLEDRLAALFGDTVGGDLAAAFADAQRPDQSADARVRGHLADFVDTAERVADGRGPARPELRELWTRLVKLPEERAARARALVRLLRRTAGGDAPHELGRRRRLEFEVRGMPLAAAARHLAERGEPVSAPPVGSWSDHDRVQLLELALVLRGTGLRLPPTGGRKLQALLGLAVDLQPEQRVALWPVVREFDEGRLDATRWNLTRSTFPGALLADALELEVLHLLGDFDDEHRARAYLDAVRRLRADPIPNVSPTADWFVAPFRIGRSWEPTLVLGLLATHHQAPESLVSILAAVRDSGLADLGFADAMAQWNEPRVLERPTDFDRVGAALDLTVSDLEQYLHWRRLAGYGETFSSAVLKPLSVVDTEEQQLAHLRALAPSPATDARIATLEAPHLRELRVDGAGRRARRAFDRALDVLRRESLAEVLNDTARAAFERLLGRRLEGKLPERVQSLMFLVAADNMDLGALRELLEDVLAGRDVADRAANQAWLAQIALRGVDVGTWHRGVDVALNVRGTTIRITTETDPLHALEMGSYFDTCLSLRGGFNAASTLTNAIDVNKQVLYGRREDGTVVARKLIAVTDAGMLLGYRTYAFENQNALDAALGQALAQFADACGLQLGATGSPRPLHDTFWYDDGVTPWRSARDEPIPEWVPGDEAGAAEWAFARGFDDPATWVGGDEPHDSTWSPASAARLHMHAPHLASPAFGDVRRYLAARGHFDWMATADDHPWNLVADVKEVLPADPAALRTLAAQMRAAGRRAAAWSSHDLLVSTSLAALPVAEIASYVVDHVHNARSARQECFEEQHRDCLQSFVVRTADVLHAAWLREGPGDLDRLWGHRDPVLVDIAIEFATRVAEPQFARRLRAMFKQRGSDGQLEWALARQGDEASRWLLQSAHEAHPDDEQLTAALDGAAQRAAPPVALSGSPSRAELLRLVDGLFRVEPTDEALQFFMATPAHGARLATLPFFASAAAMQRVATLVVPINQYLGAQLRHLFAALPASDRVAAFTFDRWDATEVLGADDGAWERHIDALIEAGRSHDALQVCDWLAAEVSPSRYEELVEALLARHAAVVEELAASVLDQLVRTRASYRLLELLIRWMKPRVATDLTAGLDDYPRTEFAKTVWARLG